MKKIGFWPISVRVDAPFFTETVTRQCQSNIFKRLFNFSNSSLATAWGIRGMDCDLGKGYIPSVFIAGLDTNFLYCS